METYDSNGEENGSIFEANGAKKYESLSQAEKDKLAKVFYQPVGRSDAIGNGVRESNYRRYFHIVSPYAYKGPAAADSGDYSLYYQENTTPLDIITHVRAVRLSEGTSRTLTISIPLFPEISIEFDEAEAEEYFQNPSSGNAEVLHKLDGVKSEIQAKVARLEEVDVEKLKLIKEKVSAQNYNPGSSGVELAVLQHVLGD